MRLPFGQRDRATLLECLTVDRNDRRRPQQPRPRLHPPGRLLCGDRRVRMVCPAASLNHSIRNVLLPGGAEAARVLKASATNAAPLKGAAAFVAPGRSASQKQKCFMLQFVAAVALNPAQWFGAFFRALF